MSTKSIKRTITSQASIHTQPAKSPTTDPRHEKKLMTEPTGSSKGTVEIHAQQHNKGNKDKTKLQVEELMELVDRQLQRAAGPLKEKIVAAMKILQTNHRLAKEKTQRAERQKRLAEDDYMLAQTELAEAEEYVKATLLKYERMMNEDALIKNKVEAEATVEEKMEGEVKENPTSIEALVELMNEHLQMSDGLTKEIAKAEIEALSSHRKLLKERCLEAEEDMERAGKLFEEAPLGEDWEAFWKKETMTEINEVSQINLAKMEERMRGYLQRLKKRAASQKQPSIR